MTWETGDVFGALEASKVVTISKSNVAPQVESLDESSKVKIDDDSSVSQAASRIRADLRTMATALEAYFVDFNKYPVTFNSLTTPIAYITRIPVDHFSKEGNKILYQPKQNDWIVWSVGPDQVDNNGTIVYDPTNGILSAGDITRSKQ